MQRALVGVEPRLNPLLFEEEVGPDWVSVSPLSSSGHGLFKTLWVAERPMSSWWTLRVEDGGEEGESTPRPPFSMSERWVPRLKRGKRKKGGVQEWWSSQRTLSRLPVGPQEEEEFFLFVPLGPLPCPLSLLQQSLQSRPDSSLPSLGSTCQRQGAEVEERNERAGARWGGEGEGQRALFLQDQGAPPEEQANRGRLIPVPFNSRAVWVQWRERGRLEIAAHWLLLPPPQCNSPTCEEGLSSFSPVPPSHAQCSVEWLFNERRWQN
jgi:hypothetical protein